MKKATLPLYIRFGKIPDNQMSSTHQGDVILRNEGGLSVWEAVEANGCYYPILPEEPNESAIADYFYDLLHNDRPVYLVTGDKLCIEGADREPLLFNVKIIKEITEHYRGKI